MRKCENENTKSPLPCVSLSVLPVLFCPCAVLAHIHLAGAAVICLPIHPPSPSPSPSLLSPTPRMPSSELLSAEQKEKKNIVVFCLVIRVCCFVCSLYYDRIYLVIRHVMSCHAYTIHGRFRFRFRFRFRLRSGSKRSLCLCLCVCGIRVSLVHWPQCRCKKEYLL